MTAQVKLNYAWSVVFKQGFKPTRSALGKTSGGAKGKDYTDKEENERPVESFKKCSNGGWEKDRGKIFYRENYLVVGNIELFNVNDLKSVLDVNCRTCDKRSLNNIIVIEGYKKWRKDLPKHLDGNFSFVLIDLQNHELFGVRDHIGFEQFYYCWDDEAIIVSNNLAGIRSTLGREPKFSKQYIIHYLSQQFPRQGATIYEDIKTLPPGFLLKCDSLNLEVEKYWDYSDSEISMANECSAQLRQIISSSIDKRISGKKNYAIQLSGGLDSSAILGLMHSAANRRHDSLFAITRIFKEQYRDARRDETKYAKEIARIYNISLHYCDQEVKCPLEELSEYYLHMGNIPYNPFFSISRPLYQRAIELGANHIITGFGGDEMVSMQGKNIFPLLLIEGRFKELLRVTGEYSENYGISNFKTIKSMIFAQMLPDRVVKKYLEMNNPGKMEEENLSFVNPGIQRKFSNGGITTEGKGKNNSFDMSSQVSNNVQNGIMQHVCEVYSFSSNQYGLQFVHPLLDKRIMEFISQVPPLELIKGGWRRSLFRRAMVGVLPESIRCRKDKSIFSLPYEMYIRSSRGAIMELIAKGNSQAWDYIDNEALKKWTDTLCDAPETVKNIDLLALKIAMAYNVGSFIDYNSRSNLA